MTKNDRKNAEEAKSKYWEKNFMPEAGEILFHFYKDVETLVGYYYDDEVLNNMKKKFMESIENVNYEEEYEFHDHMKLSTDEHKIARYILHEILPHYHKYDIYDDKRTITVNSETFWNFMGKKKNATSNDYLEEIMKDN